MRKINHSSRFIAWSSEWKNHATIRDLVETSVEKASRKCKPEDTIRYIDISSIDGESNSVIGTTEYRFSEAPSRAQQCIKKGDILVSTVRPNLKNIAVNQLDAENLVASSGFCVLRPKDKYAGLILAYVMSEPFTKKMVAEAKGSNYPAIHDSDILDYSITVPESHELARVDAFVRQSDKSKFSDFKSRFIELFGNPLSVEQKYPLKRLGDCVDINPRRPQLSLSDTDQVSFVPMPCVSEDGYLQDVDNVGYGTVKKGFTYFEEGDVLFAKITPCMENGKGAIAEDLTNGIGMGSTEYHVLREKTGISNKYWILALTRLPIFREDAAKNMTGTGGQKRVGASYLSDFRIGLPPIETQQEFEQLYRQADKSKYLN